MILHVLSVASLWSCAYASQESAVFEGTHATSCKRGQEECSTEEAASVILLQSDMRVGQRTPQLTPQFSLTHESSSSARKSAATEKLSKEKAAEEGAAEEQTAEGEAAEEESAHEEGAEEQEEEIQGDVVKHKGEAKEEVEEELDGVQSKLHQLEELKAMEATLISQKEKMAHKVAQMRKDAQVAAQKNAKKVAAQKAAKHGEHGKFVVKLNSKTTAKQTPEADKVEASADSATKTTSGADEVEAMYTFGTRGTNECPTGYENILSNRECKEAVITIGLKDMTHVEDPEKAYVRPRGCWGSTEAQIFFNSNFEDTHDIPMDTAPVCRSKAQVLASWKKKHTAAKVDKPDEQLEKKPLPEATVPKFIVGNRGSNECPTGYENVLTNKECKVAVSALGLQDMTDVDDSQADVRPRGCWGSTEWAQIFFNPNMEDTHDIPMETGPVCRSKAPASFNGEIHVTQITNLEEKVEKQGPADSIFTKFSLGIKGTNECPGGYENVYTNEECKVAVSALGLQDMTDVDDSTKAHERPKGCWGSDEWAQVFFNPNMEDKHDIPMETGPVCRSKAQVLASWDRKINAAQINKVEEKVEKKSSEKKVKKTFSQETAEKKSQEAAEKKSQETAEKKSQETSEKKVSQKKTGEESQEKEEKKYILGNQGSNDCPTGYENVLSNRVCKEAVSVLGLHDMTDVDDSTKAHERPRGCWGSAEWTQVFFNPNLADTHDIPMEARPVCRSKAQVGDSGNAGTKLEEKVEKKPSAESKIRHTMKSCECKQSWNFEGHADCTSHCCNPGNAPEGSWCIVVDPKCEGKEWGYCKPEHIVHFEALFILGTKGTNECPAGYENVLTNGDCKGAVSVLGLQDMTHADDSAKAHERPNGCWGSSEWAQIFFNPNMEDTHDIPMEARPVCRSRAQMQVIDSEKGKGNAASIRKVEEKAEKKSSEEHVQKKSSEEKGEKKSSGEKVQKKSSEEKADKKSEEKVEKKSSEERVQKKSPEEKVQKKSPGDKVEKKSSEEHVQKKSEEKGEKKSSGEKVQKKSSEEKADEKPEEKAEKNSSEEKVEKKSPEEKVQKKSPEEKADKKFFEEQVQKDILEETAEKKTSDDKVQKSSPEEQVEDKSSVEATVRYTVKSCKCQQSWNFGGHPECTSHCCNPGNAPEGSWCFVVDPDCEGKHWGYCKSEQDDLPDGWDVAFDENTQKNYYFKIGSTLSQWEKPVAADVAKKPEEEQVTVAADAAKKPEEEQVTVAADAAKNPEKELGIVPADSVKNQEEEQVTELTELQVWPTHFTGGSCTRGWFNGIQKASRNECQQACEKDAKCQYFCHGSGNSAWAACHQYTECRSKLTKASGFDTSSYTCYARPKAEDPDDESPSLAPDAYYLMPR